MTLYVCGLAFDDARRAVALIHKRKGPESVVGLLNGIGGKVEGDETLCQAMRREFREETGVDIDDWQVFADLSGEHDGFSVAFLRAFVPWPVLRAVRTTEIERVELIAVAALPYQLLVPGLHWQILLALDPSLATARPALITYAESAP